MVACKEKMETENRILDLFSNVTPLAFLWKKKRWLPKKLKVATAKIEPTSKGDFLNF